MVELRRHILMEARHRCVVCGTASVEVHHIVPYSECRTHEYSNLVALCPNCHSFAHDGKIDRTALINYKARAILFLAPEICKVMIDPDDMFDPKFGPSSVPFERRAGLIINLKSRGMLGGIIENIKWPLVRCEFCDHLITIDKSWTPQDNCMLELGERLEVYCDFSCAKIYQNLMRPIYERDRMRVGEYMLQNTREFIRP